MKRNEFLQTATRAGFGSFETLSQEDSVHRFTAMNYRCLLFLFHGAEKGHANPNVFSAQLYCGFDVDVNLHSVNRWNAQRRFVKAYVRDAGGLALEMDLVTQTVGETELRDCLGIWTAQLASLSDFNWR